MRLGIAVTKTPLAVRRKADRPRSGTEGVPMATAPTVHKLQTKSHDKPDEVRAPDKTRVEVVRLEGFTIGRFIFQPGWRWSQCVKPVAKTDSCQAAHVGYAVSGRIVVKMTDG